LSTIVKTFKSVEELPSYKNVQTELVDIKLNSFVDFSITTNINFAHDLWVFDEFKRFSGEDSMYSFDFSKLDLTYKNYSKYMVLREIFNKHNRFTTVKPKFNIVSGFIKYLSKHQMFYPNLIDIPFLEEFLADVPSERHLTTKKQAIKMFLMEIELRIPGIDFSECYKYLNKINSRKVKVERERGKHKFVPKNIHNKIISLAIKDLRNENLRDTQRAAACMIVLCAETGMRIGEFKLLEIGMLEKICVKGEKEVFYYLNFKTYKTTKETDFKWTRSFVTANSKLAYNTLTNIFTDRRKSRYLYVNEKGFEVSKSLLRFRLVEFFYRHQNELQFDKIIDHEVKQFAVTRGSRFNNAFFIPKDEKDKDIYYVTFHQYRVVLATILYNDGKGYHLDWIRQHMNHLTEEMTQHYIRLQEMEKLELNAVETLRKRSGEDGSTLITDVEGISNKHIREELQSEHYQEIYTQINKFLKKNKYNIFTDINKIVSTLSRTDIPIADLELGICAKSFNKLCERNEYLSSINDAYYLGVQIHSIEDLPHTIKRFQEKSTIISYNEKLYRKNPKYRNEFEREIKAIKKYIERKLTPELNLLRNEIDEFGLPEIYSKYPTLSEVIGSIPDIEKEVQQWTKESLLLQPKNV
jgi:integrase